MTLNGVEILSEEHLLELTAGMDQLTIDGLLSIYRDVPYQHTNSQILFYNRQKTVEQRKIWCSKLLAEFKNKNMEDGINAVQGLWTHQRMKSLQVNLSVLSVNFPNMTFEIDVMNLMMSGDVELSCLSLQACSPDDMTQPYHWLSQQRLNWAINEMKAFIGWP